jgi:hypothetical protein
METYFFPDLLASKNGHTVRVSEPDYLALVTRFPGEKGGLISKRLIEHPASDTGRWAVAIKARPEH